LGDQLLLRHICGPSEYNPFFSISAVFEVLELDVSIFLEAHKYLIKTLYLMTLEIILIMIYVLNDSSEISKGRGLLVVT
jgi:hypothetical protein